MTQIKRSAGQSAVAAAVYRAGEKLHSEYYGEDSDYTRKGGVICSEILLPSHAPPEYADRETLWNAVEEAERGKKAQLAYSFDIALQNEFSMQENIDLARQFLSDNFVSRGMVVDFAVHSPDKEDGGISNPHFHVMCPIRPIEPDGKWGNKQRREYVLDEHGERVLDEAGNYVFNAVPTTDWGKPETLEAWRQTWADLCNVKFAEKGLDCRIDHRSFVRQGVEQIPTQHEGLTVRAMEAKGIRTDKGDFNRWVRSANAKLNNMSYGTNNSNSKPFHYFVCTNYRQHGPRHCDCTSHYIRYDTLYAYVLSRLQYWSAQSDMGEEHLKRQLLHANDREQQRMVKMRDAELKRAQKRQKELDRLFSKLYEDWAAERITEYNFKVLSEKYQTEQAEVLEKVDRLQAELATEQQTVVNIDQWIGLIQQYAHPEELTAEMLNALIEKIVVHEKTIGEDGEKEQTVDIYYRFVGKID